MNSRHESFGMDTARTVLLHLFRLTTVLAATFYVVSEFPSRPLSVNEISLLVALFVISLLDIGLAHGDTADVDTALLVAGIYLYGAPSMLLMCTAVRVVVHLLLRRGDKTVELLDSLAKRYAAILVGAGALKIIGNIQVNPVFDDYLRVVLLGAVYVIVQLMTAQMGRARDRHDSIFRLLVGNLVLQGPLVAAGISVAVLTVVIIEDMGPWGIALTLLLLVIMRQSFALLLDIRSSYQLTIEALVGAMEAQRPEGRGVGEEAAAFARAVAAELGWFGARVERVGYAALLYYYGLTLSSRAADKNGPGTNPLSDVEFLRPVRPILFPLERDAVASVVRHRDVRAAFVVARSVEEFSPGRDQGQLAELEGILHFAWIDKVGRAVNRVRGKS